MTCIPNQVKLCNMAMTIKKSNTKEMTIHEVLNKSFLEIVDWFWSWNNTQKGFLGNSDYFEEYRQWYYSCWKEQGQNDHCVLYEFWGITNKYGIQVKQHWNRQMDRRTNSHSKKYRYINPYECFLNMRGKFQAKWLFTDPNKLNPGIV